MREWSWDLLFCIRYWGKASQTKDYLEWGKDHVNTWKRNRAGREEGNLEGPEYGRCPEWSEYRRKQWERRDRFLGMEGKTGAFPWTRKSMVDVEEGHNLTFCLGFVRRPRVEAGASVVIANCRWDWGVRQTSENNFGCLLFLPFNFLSAFWEFLFLSPLNIFIVMVKWKLFSRWTY